MKDLPQKELEAWRPDRTPRKAVDFVLGQLYKDTRHTITDEVVSGLTFEELIGALLLARDSIELIETEE